MVMRTLISRSQRESGQVVVIFALLLPVFLALSGVVIGVGNWYVHGKNLQTKADAGAFAGGDSWEFPCGSQIDARIDAAARLYAGSSNPQVGGVPDTSIHTVLNGSAWYDDDSNPSPTEFNSPANPSVCASMTLDVKVTEDNSFPLASLIPLFPDIKRKARVEVFEAEGISGVLPIAVRAPVPVSAAAVFYNEANGDIYGVKYLVKSNGISGLPGGLQGWTTYNVQDPNTWATFAPGQTTGVVVAVSFRGACDTNLAFNVESPPGTPKPITTSSAPCFEDDIVQYPTVNQLCNQGGGAQIVNCYWASGTWPSESVQSGLQFIRGYADMNPGNGTPAIEEGFLTSVTCTYFNSQPNNTCTARLNVVVDVGAIQGNYPPPNPNLSNLRSTDVEVRYRLVRSDGSSSCNYGNQCDLIGSGSGPEMTFSTQGNGSSPHLPLTASSHGNAVAIQIRIRNAPNHPNANCSGNNFNDNCRWFYTGNGMISTSVAPTDTQILAAPIQRGFRGDSLTSGSVQWLRLSSTAGPNCGSGTIYQDNEAASRPSGSPSCFLLDLGLKGGIAKDADEQPFLFNDGVGPSQMGALDCDPNIQQGQILIDGIVQGCGPWYAQNLFTTSPLCPAANNIFSQPNPGTPWDASYPWPPLRCIKTRPTGAMTQIERGLKLRFYNNQNQNQCPADAAGYVPGRNYWDQDTNPLNLQEFGYKDDGPPARDTHFSPQDRRVVTIFLTTSEAFAGSGQNTYPIVGFIQVYVTGFGRVSGNGSVNQDDPCGTAEPNDLDQSGGSTSGYAVWGHLIKYAVPSPNATPTGRSCDPNGSLQPCVAVLVE